MTSKITETTVENYEKICDNGAISGVNREQTTVVVYSKTTNDKIDAYDEIAAYDRGYYDGYADAELINDD